MAPGAAQPDNLLAKLQLDKEMRDIVALGFSPSGSLLAGVATDNSHTVSVWDWRNGWRLVGEGKGCMGEPPQVCQRRNCTELYVDAAAVKLLLH
jgi:hypothetical protein